MINRRYIGRIEYLNDYGGLDARIWTEADPIDEDTELLLSVYPDEGWPDEIFEARPGDMLFIQTWEKADGTHGKTAQIEQHVLTDQDREELRVVLVGLLEEIEEGVTYD